MFRCQTVSTVMLVYQHKCAQLLDSLFYSKHLFFFLLPSSFSGKSNTSHEMKMLSKRSALHVSVLLAGRREAQQTQARGAATEYQSKAQIVSRSIKSPTASGTEEKI